MQSSQSDEVPPSSQSPTRMHSQATRGAWCALSNGQAPTLCQPLHCWENCRWIARFRALTSLCHEALNGRTQNLSLTMVLCFAAVRGWGVGRRCEPPDHQKQGTQGRAEAEGQQQARPCQEINKSHPGRRMSLMKGGSLNPACNGMQLHQCRGGQYPLGVLLRSCCKPTSSVDSMVELMQSAHANEASCPPVHLALQLICNLEEERAWRIQRVQRTSQISLVYPMSWSTNPMSWSTNPMSWSTNPMSWSTNQEPSRPSTPFCASAPKAMQQHGGKGSIVNLCHMPPLHTQATSGQQPRHKPFPTRIAPC